MLVIPAVPCSVYGSALECEAKEGTDPEADGEDHRGPDYLPECRVGEDPEVEEEERDLYKHRADDIEVLLDVENLKGMSAHAPLPLSRGGMGYIEGRVDAVEGQSPYIFAEAILGN